MHKILLYLIMLIHFLLVLFVILTPFFGNNYMLFMHAIIVPFIMIHWILNDNTCVLSTIEKKIRETINNGKTIDKNICFTCRLIDPVYDFRANYDDYATQIYLITTVLWLYSIGKLYYKYNTGEIRTIHDLFI